MRQFSLVALFAFTASAYAAPHDTAHLVKERVNLPRGWRVYGPPAQDHIISLRIGLPQPDFASLERHLYEVSDPTHPRYGAYLSKGQVEELVAPHHSSLSAVNNWLATYGFTEGEIVRSPAKDWITIKIPVSLVEEMLDTKYHVYQHEESGEYLVRTTSYSLPKELHAHVDVIQPTTMFGRFKRDKSTLVWLGDEVEADIVPQGQITDPITGVTVDASCNTTITIKCLQQIYNAVDYRPKQGSIGVTAYLGQYANFQDLRSFYAEQRPEAIDSLFNVVSVKGGQNSQNLSAAGSEANLDVQFAFGLSYPLPATFYSTAGSPPFNPDQGTPTDTNEPYTDWLDFTLSQPSLPLVISTSYGDDEQSVPESFARRACAGFAQLGARGVSLLFSSGDSGVGDGNMNPSTQICHSNDGRNVTRFLPAFPASCPFVTAVGGTQHFPEEAVSRFFSGGGFSNYFARPPYQEEAVKKYLSKLPAGLYKGLYNSNGRAYPDVAAQGDLFRIWLHGAPAKVGGTSASSPTFAGIVALLNDVRLRAGQPRLGFLNPLFYDRAASGFNDITIGHNGGCGTYGFNASTGWDPVTGLGTPNFGKLKSLVAL
ncbi:hypothetical protein APHAL10511_001645 [Amanita phalloides]|nr:hypothetical protein APHAL10511_001645 [Amanita phalloides]